MPGQLFTHYFLTDGIRETPEWKASVADREAFDSFREGVARLDALYFHLYGLDRKDAEYVLSTFPIVRREDDKAFGRYRTRDLILAYMNALEAGDTDTVVAV